MICVQSARENLEVMPTFVAHTHHLFLPVIGCALLRIVHAFHSLPLKNHENRSGEQLMNYLAILK